MQRVGIITFHFAHNYGAVLQCIAMCDQIRKMGAEPIVINYRPKYHTAKYRPWSPVMYRALERYKSLKREGIKGFPLIYKSLITAAITLRDNKNFFSRITKAKNFNGFMLKTLPQSQVYKSLEMLKNNPLDADVYICGSDQIWNKNCTNSMFDEAYFLSFGDEKIKRLAYAPSMGDTNVEKYADELKLLTKNIDAVYPRESIDTAKLSALLDKEVASACDPTLFLTKKDFEKYEAPIKTDSDYLLVYTVSKSERVKEIALYVAKKHGIKIIDCSVHRYIGKTGVSYCGNQSPAEFLRYIHNARFVLTNSFHGTALSLIYNKEFATIPHSSRNARIEEILQSAGLSSRLLTGGEIIDVLDLPNIDYAPVNTALFQYRKASETLLQKWI